jgi:hypothetical protein
MVGLFKKMQKNKLLSIQCLSLADIGMAFYTYYALSNFEEFKKILNASGMSSPDFQLQIYKVFLQTLIFTSVLLIGFHLIIYYLYYQDKKFARMYVRYYSLLAAVSMLISTWAVSQTILLIPTIIYFLGFYYSTKVTSKTTA